MGDACIESRSLIDEVHRGERAPQEGPCAFIMITAYLRVELAPKGSMSTGSVNYTGQLPVSILDDRVIHPERSMGAPSHKRTDEHINLKHLHNPPAALL